MPRHREHRDPRTKEELLSKLLAFDFTGNVRELGTDTIVKRSAPNVVNITFPRSGRSYELAVHMRRPPAPVKSAKRSAPPAQKDVEAGPKRRVGRPRA